MGIPLFEEKEPKALLALRGENLTPSPIFSLQGARWPQLLLLLLLLLLRAHSKETFPFLLSPFQIRPPTCQEPER